MCIRDREEIRALARDLALREVAPVIHHFDELHEFPHEIMTRLAVTGLLGALVPEEYGGAALDYVSYALAVEELNRVDGSVGITMWAHNSLCTNPVSYTHLRAHETGRNLVCRLLLEKKK